MSQQVSQAAVRNAEAAELAELLVRAREQEATLHRQAVAVEEREQELARRLERAQQGARSLDARQVVEALSGGVCTISYAELAASTSNFSVGSILGRGDFGPVYRGEWGGQAVAIKRLDQASPSPYPAHEIITMFQVSCDIKSIITCRLFQCVSM